MRLKGMCGKEGVVHYFKVLSWHSFVEAEKNHEQPQLPIPVSLNYKSVREVSTSLARNKPGSL